MNDRARAQPEHRLDRFTQWSREVIANNKCVDSDGTLSFLYGAAKTAYEYELKQEDEN